MQQCPQQGGKVMRMAYLDPSIVLVIEGRSCPGEGWTGRAELAHVEGLVLVLLLIVLLLLVAVM